MKKDQNLFLYSDNKNTNLNSNQILEFKNGTIKLDNLNTNFLNSERIKPNQEKFKDTFGCKNQDKTKYFRSLSTFNKISNKKNVKKIRIKNKSLSINSKDFNMINDNKIEIDNREKEKEKTKPLKESQKKIKSIVKSKTGISSFKVEKLKCYKETETLEIINQMIKKEHEFKFSDNSSFLINEDICSKRVKAIDFMKNLVIKMNFKTKTFFLCVKYLDKILQSKSIENNHIFSDTFLLSIVVIGSKYIENDPMAPRLDLFCSFVNSYRVNSESIKRCEVEVVNSLKYNLNFSTLYDYIEVLNLNGMIFNNDIIELGADNSLLISDFTKEEIREKISKNILFIAKSTLTTLIKDKSYPSYPEYKWAIGVVLFSRHKLKIGLWNNFFEIFEVSKKEACEMKCKIEDIINDSNWALKVNVNFSNDEGLRINIFEDGEKIKVKKEATHEIRNEENVLSPKIIHKTINQNNHNEKYNHNFRLSENIYHANHFNEKIFHMDKKTSTKSTNVNNNIKKHNHIDNIDGLNFNYNKAELFDDIIGLMSVKNNNSQGNLLKDINKKERVNKIVSSFKNIDKNTKHLNQNHSDNYNNVDSNNVQNSNQQNIVKENKMLENSNSNENIDNSLNINMFVNIYNTNYSNKSKGSSNNSNNKNENNSKSKKSEEIIEDHKYSKVDKKTSNYEKMEKIASIQKRITNNLKNNTSKINNITALENLKKNLKLDENANDKNSFQNIKKDENINDKNKINDNKEYITLQQFRKNSNSLNKKYQYLNNMNIDEKINLRLNIDCKNDDFFKTEEDDAIIDKVKKIENSDKNKTSFYNQIQTHQINSQNLKGSNQNFNFSKIKNKLDEDIIESNYHKKNKESLNIKYTDFSSPNFKSKEELMNYDNRLEDLKKEKGSLIDKTKSIFINNNFKYNEIYNDLVDAKSKNISSNYSQKVKNDYKGLSMGVNAGVSSSFNYSKKFNYNYSNVTEIDSKKHLSSHAPSNSLKSGINLKNNVEMNDNRISKPSRNNYAYQNHTKIDIKNNNVINPYEHNSINENKNNIDVNFSSKYNQKDNLKPRYHSTLLNNFGTKK